MPSGDFLVRLPVKGDTWQHTKTGNLYHVEGSVYNAITDAVDVVYLPLYPCEWPRFTRQIVGHPKAWMTPNDDGSPRFVRLGDRS